MLSYNYLLSYDNINKVHEFNWKKYILSLYDNRKKHSNSDMGGFSDN